MICRMPGAKRKGQMLPVFFGKIMIVCIVIGVIMWMIYSAINSEEIVVTMRQDRNHVELWHQVLKSDIFRMESEDTLYSSGSDYKMYFDWDKIDAAFTDSGGGGIISGDISCRAATPVEHCINFYPNQYYLKIYSGYGGWYMFTNDPDDKDPNIALDDVYPADGDFEFAEVIGVVRPSNENPAIGKIEFEVKMYE